MKAVRSRKDAIAYKKYLASLRPEDGCQFCSMTREDSQYVAETDHFFIIRNLFPYSSWDNQTVAEHLMIIPRRHVTTLKQLSFAASKEYVDTISDYEHGGYSIYSRSPGSHSRSVAHQHTHLIKLQPLQKSMTILLTSKIKYRLLPSRAQ